MRDEDPDFTRRRGPVLALLAPRAPAQTPSATTPEPGPSFDLVVRAPDPLKAVLENHLELRRYREVHDLDDAEIARLIVTAEKQARELLATEGYFAPQLRIAREQGATRPVIAVGQDIGFLPGSKQEKLNQEHPTKKG